MGEQRGWRCWPMAAAAVLLLAVVEEARAVVLTPPYFNLAEGRRVTASATCGEDIVGPELYCKLVGANADSDVNVNLIQGQVCDYCDPTRPEKAHPAAYAVDGAETWWQSPPLSRGVKYNEVNLTIELGQEFHVAYVFIKMANSPRPGIWVLERSLDNGATYQPWQYFADSIGECERYFGPDSFVQYITRDDSVICETHYSKVVPLEGGEIVVSLLNNRPSANDFFNSTILQEWTRATNVRLRLLRTKTFLGHLMSIARQDPTVTRRYFYSIKDISIGGRCVCNGHADTCDITDPNDPYKLLCRCQHNTCGANCDTCCKGFEQKAWRQSKSFKPFVCEPCNCFGHTEECEYDPEVDAKGLSLDIHGNYEGGGVCKNCRDNTEGINCNQCKPGFYRPYGKMLNETDVCQPCECDYFYATGNCAEGSGQCECRPEFTPPNCDSCSFGYYGYPNCKPCECHLNGTRGFHCEPTNGLCPCKANYRGKFCTECEEGYYNFPECLACDCNPEGSTSDKCDVSTGQCFCKNNYGGRTCSECQDGYSHYPECRYCNCDIRGTLPGVCNKETGQCLCREGYGGERCDRCVPGYYGYPDCRPCSCSDVGSSSTICDASGRCSCLINFSGRTCNQCSPGHYQYPECLSCDCNPQGSIGISCDNDGKCQCKSNFDGNHCDQCKEGFYNFPICEECNCDPAGVVETFAGCGSVPPGELCQCKDRVQGRICNECRPLFWNLQASNPDGCEKCDCYLPGVMGGLGVCDTKTGQCYCKTSVGSRRCDECKDGMYNLKEENLFGCSDCGCDIGGSVHNKCDKQNGQCPCRPRVTGRTCREPLKTYYFPTLYHNQYEAEEGRTPANSPVRYGFDEEVFPGYSWKGYAVFNLLQDEILHTIYIPKSSLYRMVLRYINNNEDSILGHIRITPDNPNDIEQTFQVLFRPTAGVPTFVTVSGPTGSIPSPMVMNPGTWTISIKNDKSLLLDYFVLLPAAYYEATVLVDKVIKPCEIGNKDLCRHYRYPNISQFDTVRGDGGFLSKDDTREPLTEYFSDYIQLHELQKPQLPLINKRQNEIHLEITISKPGPHVLLLNYITPANDSNSTTVSIEARSQNYQNSAQVVLYGCPYTELCRQAVTDKQGQLAVFDFDTNYISLILKGRSDTNIALDSVVAIPFEEWSVDYQQPKPACVRKDGKCVQALFHRPPNSKKVEFETGNEQRVAKEVPRLFDNSTQLIYLDHSDPMIDVMHKVPSPGSYVFVVRYYQPDHPAFDLDVVVHNGQFYEAKLPVQHCPSNSGCRSVIRQSDQNTNFQLTENYILTFKAPDTKSVWLDYVLLVPADQFTEEILEEEPIDHTGAFIKQCGHNHFYMDTNTEGFCRDAVFSITTEYNNGALPCSCNVEGSLSFECEKFGGQCTCKPNVIGRNCDLCKTGFFGFPDCRPCDCPSNAICETFTGECTCRPRVTGENCDQCIPYTYGFDPIIGCEDCSCDILGVVDGNQQCDRLNGSCQCKPNVVGRTCDHCKPGHHHFPYCDMCDCDRRGTTSDICDQNTAECFCKNNVYGQACDLCKDGTFNIEAKNPDGCTKCFCSGKTTRCTSSNLYRTQVSTMDDWMLAVINIEKTVIIEPLTAEPAHLGAGIGADLTLEEAYGKIVYFVAPDRYLGNKLTAYGGALNYSIYYTTGLSGSAESGADVILHSGDTYLLYYSLEQPAATITFKGSVDILESNFLLPSGLSATREQLMYVLQNLQGVYIRATYWKESVTSRLNDVTLDIATEGYHPNSSIALAVEQCQCPPNYQGLSCEDCAPGYYRAQTGPYGGFCVPCNCHGHSNTCDPVTGICFDCKNNTEGDHCERCIMGYHGNATVGTQVDCMICACPLPLVSNNFATGCEVSADGEEISCDCIPGYYGARCEYCAAGYYGRPQEKGEICQPCSCSGNINPDDPGACDSITGKCLRCLNNTYGEACNLCKPGFFGDAVDLKDCRSCDCDKCGTKECDSFTGKCICHENVIGEKCDRCADDHFGFSTCQGCTPCDCQEASESTQCDDVSGACRCRPGVSGRTCDRCTPGYWNYSASGCISCGCNTEYSVGFGCDPLTGQCQCLPGVIGEKCDQCRYRWVLIENQGCFECDSCIHNLLDVTDHLTEVIEPYVAEFESAAASFFTTQRLVYINSTASQLAPNVSLLDPGQVDLTPHTYEVESLEQDVRNLNRRTEYAVENAEQCEPDALKVQQEAVEVDHIIQLVVDEADTILNEVNELALSLDSGTGPQIDQALREAEDLLSQIHRRNFTDRQNAAQQELYKAIELLEKMQEFAIPVHNQTDYYGSLKHQVNLFDGKLEDLRNYSLVTKDQAAKTDEMNERNKNAKVMNKVHTADEIIDETEQKLDKSFKLLDEAQSMLDEAGQQSPKLSSLQAEIVAKQETLLENIDDKEKQFDELDTLAEQSRRYSEELQLKAEELEGLFSGSRYSAEHAVGAANAYINIAKAIEEAMKAAYEAQEPVENATAMSNGLGERTALSQTRSTELLEEARQTLDKAQGELVPQLEDAENRLDVIDGLNKHIESVLSNVNNELTRIPVQETVERHASEAIQNAKDANATAQNTLSTISRIINQLPEDVTLSQQLPRDADSAMKAVNQANLNVEQVTTVVPNIRSLMASVGERQNLTARASSDIGRKIEELKRQVALARDHVNRIDVGATFQHDSILELKNPESLPHLGTSTHVSMYFNTDKPNGFLFYMGNEVGTSRRIRRAKTDDFIALEVENGYPVLIIDLGSGPQKIINEKYVADMEWYEAIIERTGLIAKLIIRHEGPGGQEEVYEKEAVLTGTHSILNLDQEQSKIFVGGYPADFDMQPAIQTASFDGKIEGLVVGDTPLSLWNFIDADKISGAKERDKLVNLQQSTGYRFDGSGYVQVAGKSYNLKQQSDIQLSFKTFAKNGLLFLVGRGSKSFLSVELRNGSVLYQFNLGPGLLSIESPKTYNDGNWHTVGAIRYHQDGVLKVDGERIFQGKAPEKAKDLKFWDNLYFGGYPGEHNIVSVTNVDFDGCIDQVQIEGTPVDLSHNTGAFGVTPGCPAQVASLISFSDRSPGYIKWPNASSTNQLRLSLRFKTEVGDGLLFYGTDQSQNNVASLSLQDGRLVFSSQREQLYSSQSTQYNDNQWHVVTATHDSAALHLDVDDFDTFTTDTAPPLLHFMYGTLLFGGLPPDFEPAIGAAASVKPFIGCLGDAVVNGVFINFANAKEHSGVILGKCQAADQVVQPPKPPISIPDSYDEDYAVVEEPEETTETVHETEQPEVVFVPEVIPATFMTTTTTTTSTTTTTTTTTTPSTTTSSTEPPPDQCRLPLRPAYNPDASFDTHGYFVSRAENSRILFDKLPGRVKNRYDFSLQFKTHSSEGVLFYVADIKHIDFISLYMKYGRLVHAFNCGTGAANITSTNKFDDGMWHTVEFSRHFTSGTLIVDGQSEGDGQSPGDTKSINVDPPVYVGGVPQEIVEKVRLNVKVHDFGFEGCLRGLTANGTDFPEPTLVGVRPCSFDFEKGVFFGENGGFIRARPVFRVGLSMKIQMDVKPRSMSGILLSVHGKADFLLLQMVNGTVKFSIDNGNGPISATYTPMNKNYLCDGQWHQILAVKYRNVVTLSIDSSQGEPIIGRPGKAATDTKSPLMIGGRAKPNLNLRGLEAEEHFVGCMKNIIINDRPVNISKVHLGGDIMSGSCPLT